MTDLRMNANAAEHTVPATQTIHPLILAGKCAFGGLFNSRQLRAIRADWFADAHNVSRTCR